MEPKIVEAVFLGTRPGGPRTWKLWFKNTFIVRPYFKYVLMNKFVHRHFSMDIQHWLLGKMLHYSGMPGLFSGGSIGDTFENDLMKLIFNATAIANIADNAASSPLTNLFIALHTADPGETGTAATSEVGYTSYARATVARTSGGWTVTNNSVSPVANIDFAAGTGGSGTVTHASITTVVTVGNASKILFSGTVTPNIVTGNGVTPRLTTAMTITID